MKKLIILGCCDIDYNEIDFDNNIIWTVASSLFIAELKRKKLDAIFEIHRKDEYTQDTYSEIYKTNLPVYMQKLDKKVKNCLIFPFELLFEIYGTFFTNSISLMLCFAVMGGFTDITIAGVEMESDRESLIEKDNLSYWIGYHRAKGTKVNIQKASWLCRNVHIYGVDNILAHREKITNRLNYIKRKREHQIYKYVYSLKQIEKVTDKKEQKKLYREFYDASKLIDEYNGIVEALEWELKSI